MPGIYRARYGSASAAGGGFEDRSTGRPGPRWKSLQPSLTRMIAGDHMAQHRHRETTREDWVRTTAYVAVFVAAITIATIFLLPAYWYIWITLAAAGLFLLVQWHAKNFAYRCPRCGHEFEISTFTDLTSPHWPSKSGGWKRLECPRCHETVKAAVTKK